MMRAIFQSRAVSLYKNVFSEYFCPVCDKVVSADMDISKCGQKKNIIFHREEKPFRNEQKRTKYECCVNPPKCR